MWYKFRTSSSHGYSKWIYRDIVDSENMSKESLVDLMERISGVNTGHDLYHGMQYMKVKVENIPGEIIKGLAVEAHKDIERYVKASKSAAVREKQLKSMLKKCKVMEPSKRCKSCKGKGYQIFKNAQSGKPKQDCFICRSTGRVKEYSTSYWD